MHTHDTPTPRLLEKATYSAKYTPGRGSAFTRRDLRVLRAAQKLPEHLRYRFIFEHATLGCVLLA